jgi:hypothetical protein
MQKDVHDLDFTTQVAWDNGKLNIVVSVTNNEEGDAIPPELDVTTPRQGYLYMFNRELIPLPVDTSILVGTITIKAEASDDSGIERVDFEADGEILFTDTQAPYEYEYDGTFGEHIISVVVYDTFGNYATKSMSTYVINI